MSALGLLRHSHKTLWDVLLSLHLLQYYEKFMEHAFDSELALRSMSEEDMKMLGVRLGHRRILQNWQNSPTQMEGHADKDSSSESEFTKIFSDAWSSYMATTWANRGSNLSLSRSMPGRNCVREAPLHISDVFREYDWPNRGPLPLIQDSQNDLSVTDGDVNEYLPGSLVNELVTNGCAVPVVVTVGGVIVGANKEFDVFFGDTPSPDTRFSDLLVSHDKALWASILTGNASDVMEDALSATISTHSGPKIVSCFLRQSIDSNVPSHIVITIIPANAVPYADVVGFETSGNMETDLSMVRKGSEDLNNESFESHIIRLVSHEFYTPLNAVLGSAQILMVEVDDPEIQAFAETIHRAADHLFRLVAGLMDFQETVGGIPKLELSLFDPLVHVEAALAVTQPMALRKGLDILFVVDPFFKRRIRGDYFRFNQAVVNLLTNAIRFTNEGGIVVEAKAVHQDGQDFFSVAIEDTGVGIAHKHRDAIFNKFFRYGEAGGIGVGLSVAKRLVEAMGGTITVKSTLGVGSTFTITVPEDNTRPKGTTSVVDGPPPVDFKGWTCLVIYQDNIVRQSLVAALKSWNLDVYVCTDADMKALKDKVGENGNVFLAIFDSETNLPSGARFRVSSGIHIVNNEEGTLARVANLGRLSLSESKVKQVKRPLSTPALVRCIQRKLDRNRKHEPIIGGADYDELHAKIAILAEHKLKKSDTFNTPSTTSSLSNLSIRSGASIQGFAWSGSLAGRESLKASKQKMSMTVESENGTCVSGGEDVGAFSLAVAASEVAEGASGDSCNLREVQGMWNNFLRRSDESSSDGHITSFEGSLLSPREIIRELNNGMMYPVETPIANSASTGVDSTHHRHRSHSAHSSYGSPINTPRGGFSERRWRITNRDPLHQEDSFGGLLVEGPLSPRVLSPGRLQTHHLRRKNRHQSTPIDLSATMPAVPTHINSPPRVGSMALSVEDLRPSRMLGVYHGGHGRGGGVAGEVVLDRLRKLEVEMGGRIAEQNMEKQAIHGMGQEGPKMQRGHRNPKKVKKPVGKVRSVAKEKSKEKAREMKAKVKNVNEERAESHDGSLFFDKALEMVAMSSSTESTGRVRPVGKDPLPSVANQSKAGDDEGGPEKGEQEQDKEDIVDESGLVPEEEDSRSPLREDRRRSMKGLCALVVDDNRINRMIVSRFLKIRNFSVIEAANGKEAVDLYAEKLGEFSVVFMDIQMPVMNGFMATKEIRKLGEGLQKKVPIIGITAFADEDSNQRALRVGMDSLIHKPIIKQKLFELLDEHIEVH